MSPLSFRFWLPSMAAVAAVMLAGCQTAPSRQPPPAEAGVSAPARGKPAELGSARQSAATTPRAYRESGASHLYGLNKDRIYQGRMPPMLYAVGVLDIELDRTGKVMRLDWRRAPRHAPEVMKEIERMVQAASPFPAPTRLGRVVYTDIWLWHSSGRFQLDTLTEGQD